MKLNQKTKTALGSLMIAIILVIAQYFYSGHTPGKQQLIVWFFDIGQGDAIYIESPSGFQMLIDGGPSDAVLDKLGSVMPFWDRHLDAVVLTHPHADHLDGLVEVVDRYRVDSVYLTHVDYFTPTGPEFDRRISDDETVIEVTEPMTIDLGEGVVLQIIYPTMSFVGERIEDLNESSIVALLTYGETSVLLTGDETAKMEPELMAAIDGEVDVLKVGHHGSAYSSTMEFLQDIDPEVAVISCAADNDYGHPASATLDRLMFIGAQVFRTDLDSDIRLTSDGGEPVVVSKPL